MDDVEKDRKTADSSILKSKLQNLLKDHEQKTSAQQQRQQQDEHGNFGSKELIPQKSGESPSSLKSKLQNLLTTDGQKTILQQQQQQQQQKEGRTKTAKTQQ